MNKTERLERITIASEAVHSAYGDAMDLYTAVHRRLDDAELEKIGAIWRQLSKAARELRDLELDATI